VVANAGTTTISWSLNSVLGGTYLIDFFANPAATLNAEGRTYLDPATLGFSQATATLSAAPTFFGSTVIPGTFDYITATATNTSLTETSEFSAAALARAAVLSPTSLNFGNVVVNSSSGSQSASLTSVGAAPFQISYLGDSTFCYGGNPICTGGAFICSTTCATGTPYATGAACSFTATFAPITLGAQTTTIDICDNAGGNPRTLTLAGTGVVPPPATISPSSFDFGNIEQGTASAIQTFTVSNPAPVSISLTAFSVTGPYVIVSTTCTTTLAAASSCGVDVKFTPAAVGPTTGTLSSTASSGGVSASLTGTGVAGPPATLTPPSVDFGAVTLGSSAGPATFTLSNPAALPMTLSAFTVSAPFSLFSTTCGGSLPGGSSCTADVKFTPSAAGPASGSISITAGGATYSSGLAGSGTALPTLQVTPVAFDFGSVLLGTSSATKTFGIANPSATAASISPPSVTGPFQLLSTTCGASIPALSSCAADVKFVPVTTGAAAGALVVTSSGGSASSTLSGTGIRQAAVSIPTSPIEFGSLVKGSAPVAQTVTLKNSGNATLGINGITVGSPFTLINGCPASLGAGESCNLTVTFDPTTLGDYPALLSISTNAPNGFVQIRVHAGVQSRPEPLVRVDPRTIGFGERIAGSPSPSQRITLTNDGGATASLNLSITTAHFLVQNTTCGATLGPQQTCYADVVFQAVGFGPKRGQYVVSSNSPDTPQVVNLSGAGCRPAATGQERGGPAINCAP
jgi:hypothetical protein